MALKARVQKVSRNSKNPQVDLEVVYFDDAKKFQIERVFTLPVDEELTLEKIEALIQSEGKIYKDDLVKTIQKEDEIRDEYQGKEFDIE